MFQFQLMTPIVWLTRLLVGAYPQWEGCKPSKRQRIYFANHTSHLDTIVIWTSLPSILRRHTRPVAAKDYWDHGLFRKRIAMKELNVVLIDRKRTEHADPLGPLKEALRAGDSLIIFPEGTRRPQPLPSEFKSNSSRYTSKTCTALCPKAYTFRCPPSVPSTSALRLNTAPKIPRKCSSPALARP